MFMFWKNSMTMFKLAVNLSGRERDRPGLRPQFLYNLSAVVSQGFEDLGVVVSPCHTVSQCHSVTGC